MGKIYSYATDRHSCLVVPDNIEQCIYRIGNSLVASEDARDLRILGKIGQTHPMALKDLLLELNPSEIHVLSSEGNFRISGSTAKRIDSESQIPLEDMVFELYLSCKDAPNFQLGFRDEKSARLLFSPVTRVESAEEYMSKGVMDEKKRQLNNRVYGLLLANLSERTSLPTATRHYTDIKSLFVNSASRIKEELQKTRLRSQTRDILSNYLGATYSFFNTVLLKDKLGDVEKSISRRQGKPHNPQQMQELLDNEFLKQKGLILRSPHAEEVAAMLQKESGCVGKKLRHSGLALLAGDRREIDRIFSFYRQKSFSSFSPALQRLAQSTHFYYNKGVYIPELLSDYFRNYRPPYTYNSMWNLDDIGAYEAQNTTRGNGASIGIIDTGVDYNHKELASLFGNEKGWDFVRDAADPQDLNGHGTHVSGTAAGLKTGIANMCRLYSLRILDENGVGTLSDLVEAVSWALKNQIQVINLSLGSKTPSDLEYLTFKEAVKAGLLVAAAAGNDQNGPDYPGAYDCVMAVAAVDRRNNHADFSNIQKTNNVSAPGVQVYSCLPNNQYGCLSGTSMATPHLSGVCALAKSLNPKINQDNFVNLIDKTAQPLGNQGDPDNQAEYGAGLLRADKLVKVVKNGR
jgi:subtilisin